MFTVKVDQLSEKKPRLNEEELEVLRAKLKAKRKLLRNYALFKLIMSGSSASLSTPKELRIPISVKDVQDLLFFSISGDVQHLNRWFLLKQSKQITQTVVLVIDNISINDIEENQGLFTHTLGIFEDGVEMINPISSGLSLGVALAYSPITNALKGGIAMVYTSLKEALDDGHVFSITNIHEQNDQEEKTSADDRKKQEETKTNENTKGCTKAELLLSALQLVTGHYPFPGYGDAEEFVFTKDKYEPVTEHSPMFALDCEWCVCEDGLPGLARVAIVDENLDPVYHTYVLPDKPIKNLATKWSGITYELLKGAQKRLCDVQQDIRNLFPPDAILVGHSLRGDLLALRLFHPYIIDSSVIYNMTGSRISKSKLQFLAKIFCNRDIQSDRRQGHDPNEDALASMELVLLKISKGLKYGDSRLNLDGSCEGPSKEKILSVISNSIFNFTSTFKSHVTDFDLQDVLLMKFFTYTQSVDKSAVLIIQPTHDKIYRPKTPLHRGLFHRVTGDLEILQETELKGVVPALESRMNKDIVFVHTVVEEKNDKGHLTKVDEVIEDIYNKTAMGGMMIVIFGGKRNPMENGVCMIRVKKPSRDDVLKKLPEMTLENLAQMEG